jgi:hypothetical protein
VVSSGSRRGRKGEVEAAGEKISPAEVSFSGMAAAGSLPASFTFRANSP